MADVEVKDDRRYTKNHEWAKGDDGEIVVGVSAFAVEQLGDITMVTIDVSEGDEIEAGKPYGTVESVKTLADLFAPVTGKVLRSNEALEDEPELINDDCYDKGWLIAIAPSDKGQLDGLIDPKAYTALIEAEDS
jgi:glycine cleavage system H protein